MAFEVSKGLAARGWEVHLVYEKEGVWFQRYRIVCAKTHAMELPILALRRPWQAVRTAFRLQRLIQKEGGGVVFTSYSGHLTLAGLLEFLFRTRTCFHLGLRGEVGASQSGRWAAKSISAAITPSDNTRESWLKPGWPERTIRTVPNWIDWEDYLKLPTKEEAREMLGIGTAAPARRGLGASSAGEREVEGGKKLKVVAYVGRLVEEKGIEVLLEAWNRGLAQDEDGVLLVAGTGKPEYEAKLKAKAAKNVKFLGGLPDTKSVYRASDLTVVPSLWEEPFGLVPLEAVACGSVPLVSDRGFLPEIVKETETGLIHPAGNAERLREEMQRWLGGDGSTLGRRLLEVCRARYSAEAGLTKYEAMLQAR